VTVWQKYLCSIAASFVDRLPRARDIGSATFDKEADMQDVERVILAAEVVSGDQDKAIWWLS
jgi:hypothetical protein